MKLLRFCLMCIFIIIFLLLLTTMWQKSELAVVSEDTNSLGTLGENPASLILYSLNETYRTDNINKERYY